MKIIHLILLLSFAIQACKSESRFQDQETVPPEEIGTPAPKPVQPPGPSPEEPPQARDSTPPTLSFAENGFPPGTLAIGQQLTIQFEAFDDQSSPVQLTCQQYEGDVQISSQACQSSTKHTFSGLLSGQFRFVVRARDAAGNSSSIVTPTYSIDGTPPTVRILDVGLPGAETIQTGVAFSFQGTDEDSGVQYFILDLDGQITQPHLPLTMSYSGLSQGTHRFSVKAVDWAGNVSAEAAHSWRIIAAPTATPQPSTSPSATPTSTPAATATPIPTPTPVVFSAPSGEFLLRDRSVEFVGYAASTPASDTRGIFLLEKIKKPVNSGGDPQILMEFGPSSALWTLEYANGSTLLPSQASSVTSSTLGTSRLTTWTLSGGVQAALTATIEDSKKLRLKLQVTGPTNANFLKYVHFPILKVKPNLNLFPVTQPTDASGAFYCAIPWSKGRVIGNPFSSEHLPRTGTPAEIDWSYTYPGRGVMQFVSCYGRGGGFLLYEEDLDGFEKIYRLSRPRVNPTELTMSVKRSANFRNSGSGLGSFTMNYDSVVMPISGDWYDASAQYRRWATENAADKWLSKGPLYLSSSNSQRPSWLYFSPAIFVTYTDKHTGTSPQRFPQAVKDQLAEFLQAVWPTGTGSSEAALVWYDWTKMDSSRVLNDKTNLCEVSNQCTACISTNGSCVQGEGYGQVCQNAQANFWNPSDYGGKCFNKNPNYPWSAKQPVVQNAASLQLPYLSQARTDDNGGNNLSSPAATMYNGRWFPLRPGLRAAVSDLREMGIRVMPYMNTRIFDQGSCGETGPCASPSAAETLRGSVIRRENGSYKYYSLEHPFWDMDRSSPVWRTHYKNFVERVLSPQSNSDSNFLGAGGVYLDSMGGYGSPNFESSDTGAQGNFQYRAMHGFCSEVESLRAQYPDLATMDENGAEVLIDVRDMSITHDNDVPGGVPIRQAVYHDYWATTGRSLPESENVMRDTFFNDSWDGVCAEPCKTVLWEYIVARQLIDGQLIGRVEVPPVEIRNNSGAYVDNYQNRLWGILKPEFDVKRAFLKTALQVKWDNRMWLNTGVMLRPPTVEVEKINIPSNDEDKERGGKYTLRAPRVLAAAYRNPASGVVRIYLVNFSEDTVNTGRIRARVAEYLTGARRINVVPILGGASSQAIDILNGSSEYDVVSFTTNPLPPMSFVVLELN